MASHKETLVRFLEARVFDPIMRAQPDDLPAADRPQLAHVQDATRAEIERFRNYGSAEEVVTNFKRDLHSKPAKRIHRESRALKLPTLDDVRDEFLKRASDLGLDA